ncbi:MAG: GxxExxY protein [Saprospiraceae bacterium]|jgi:GxxExxY protein|nr:GxxExxY protein [Saprospiraceae bacterium]
MRNHDLIYKEECYKVIGLCMEIHRILGKGLNEIVYKDAMEYEFRENKIHFSREKEFKVSYKNVVLNHHFYADFVIYDNLILEVKACENIHDDFVKQTLNYISIAKSNLGLILNFGGASFEYKRVINTLSN